MAVVALGLTLGSERTCISPESEKPVHHFWEMLGYLANTALFVMVGILISEVALVGVTRTDMWYLVGLYFQLTLIRLVKSKICLKIEPHGLQFSKGML